jgi:hypothetical protein
VKDVTIRPMFEGTYSNVWTGTLDGSQKVSSRLPTSNHIHLTHGSQVAIKCLRDRPITQKKAKRVRPSFFVFAMLMVYTGTQKSDRNMVVP